MVVVLDGAIDVTAAAVLDGVVAGVPPVVVHAPNPKAAATATTAKLCCISINHTEHNSSCKTLVSKLFPRLDATLASGRRVSGCGSGERENGSCGF
jgi:hypothetical protein